MTDIGQYPEPEAPRESSEPEAPRESPEPEAPRESSEPEAPRESPEPEAPREQPTPRMKGKDRREQLLDIALELFSTQGFIQTSVDDIASKAGVTKPVFYQHFLSKESLYRELLENVASKLLAQVEAAATEAASPREQVEKGVLAYFRFIAANENAFYLLFGTGGRRDDEFAQVGRTVERTMAETVAALIEAGIGKEHRLLLAYGIVGLAESTGRHWLESRRAEITADLFPADPDVLARWIAEIAWGGLRGITRD